MIQTLDFKCYATLYKDIQPLTPIKFIILLKRITQNGQEIHIACNITSKLTTLRKIII